jgi:flagellar biosynthetic protein FlhB
MSEDLQDKTEEASSKKLTDGRKKGQVGKSQDLTASVLLFIGMLVLLFFAPYFYHKFEDVTLAVLNNLYEPIDTINAATAGFQAGLMFMVVMLAPLFVALYVAAFLINVVQVGFVISLDPIQPKFKNINVFDPKNYKKFFGVQAMMKLFFGLSKLGVIALVCFLQIYALMLEISHLVHATCWEMFLFLAWQSFYMGLMIAIILLVLGVLEFMYQKWKFANDMKMTKQEVKDERRQSEGDVLVKSKMRSLMAQFSRSRMKANVPHADVIIANPTHYAIAIKYDPDQVPAPICVAKGMRKMAIAIKDVAKEHKVPIVENPPLARGMYNEVEVGGLVPPEFYHPVAEVLAYVYRLNDKMGAKMGDKLAKRGAKIKPPVNK